MVPRDRLFRRIARRARGSRRHISESLSVAMVAMRRFPDLGRQSHCVHIGGTLDVHPQLMSRDITVTRKSYVTDPRRDNEGPSQFGGVPHC